MIYSGSRYQKKGNLVLGGLQMATEVVDSSCVPAVLGAAHCIFAGWSGTVDTLADLAMDGFSMPLELFGASKTFVVRSARRKGASRPLIIQGDRTGLLGVG